MNIKERISVIWNVTQNCLWNCKFCCVDAKYVSPCGKHITSSNLELTFEQKLFALQNISPENYKIDFSGGEIFIDPQNIDLLTSASKAFGVENVGVSTSGACLTDDIAKKLSAAVSSVELSIDAPLYSFYYLRPVGYHQFAGLGIKLLKKHNVKVGVQTVLTRENFNENMLKNLMNDLISLGVDDWSILRFFPVGRGEKFKSVCLTEEEYLKICKYIKEIANNKINVNLQYVLPNSEKDKSCRAVKKSVGILPDGTVVSCFWALGSNMKPLADKYVLGNILNDSLDVILKNEKSSYWLKEYVNCELCKDIKNN